MRSAGAWRGAEDVGVGGITLRRMLAVLLWPPGRRHSVLMVVGHDSGCCSASASGSWCGWRASGAVGGGWEARTEKSCYQHSPGRPSEVAEQRAGCQSRRAVCSPFAQVQA